MRQWIVVCTLTAIAVTSFPAYADQATSNDSGIYNSGIYIVPSVAYHVLDDDGNIDDLGSFGLNVGYQWNEHWALELGVRGGTTDTRFGDDADMLGWEVNALYRIVPRGRWQPYAIASLMDISFDTDKTRHETLTGLGVGSYYHLSETIRLRGDARVIYSYDDNLVDYAFTLGVQFSIGGKK